MGASLVRLQRRSYQIRWVEDRPQRSPRRRAGKPLLKSRRQLIPCANGQAVNVHFSPKTKTCTFDLKVVYSDDDSSAVWSKIDLCTVEKITIKYNRKSDETTASFD
jgi:hypothetical protein